MGDLNAKVEIDNTGYEDITGQHGLEERNDSAKRFATLCAFKKLVIGGPIFPHKRIHKATWISPDHTTENQIDHICVNEKFRKTMEDVRTRRGADIASDHQLVVANLKLKLKKNWTSRQTAIQRFNTAFLRDTDKFNEFKIALNNRFQALQDLLNEEETTMEDNWKGIKEALTSTCQEVLGLKKHHHKEWVSIETLEEIKERKKKTAINNGRTLAEKVQKQDEYIEANKQVKKIIRADKKKPASMNSPDIEAAHTDLPMDVNPLTTEGIRMAIRKIKSGQTAGPDNIPAEALKSDIEVNTNMPHPLFKKIWEKEQVPMDWKEGHLIEITKEEI
ncbi:unnamed protein product [Schistosoma curassoni]|uniref:Endo/exonuclease/phosphatase domain-containing protein n=1 Tax=Schistosoma curassoni TaxID=6186 RepID=A0A183KA96_9TREM|nr:unnamed protein product [Schistosoma curassoni]